MLSTPGCGPGLLHVRVDPPVAPFPPITPLVRPLHIAGGSKIGPRSEVDDRMIKTITKLIPLWTALALTAVACAGAGPVGTADQSPGAGARSAAQAAGTPEGQVATPPPGTPRGTPGAQAQRTPVADQVTMAPTFYALSADARQAIAVDAETGQVLRTIDVGVTPRSASVSPDGRFLWIADGSPGASQVVVWDLATLQRAEAVPVEQGFRLVITPYVTVFPRHEKTSQKIVVRRQSSILSLFTCRPIMEIKAKAGTDKKLRIPRIKNLPGEKDPGIKTAGDKKARCGWWGRLPEGHFSRRRLISFKSARRFILISRSESV